MLVDDPGCNLAAAYLMHHRSSTIECCNTPVGIDTALEAQRCLGDQPEGATGTAGAGGIERGGLQEDVHGVFRDLRVIASHDPCQSDRAGRIADEQHIGRELALRAIERGEFFVLGSAAHDDVCLAIRIGTERGSIKRMQRLAELEHHVVRNVDDVVHGSLTSSDDLGSQPVR